MREYECPYDENVLVRVMEPKDGMAYVYARQLFNQHGNVFHVVQSRNPSIVLVDGESGQINLGLLKLRFLPTLLSK